MEKFSYLRSSNSDYIDDLFDRYLENPDSVDESWRYFFEGLELGGEAGSSASSTGNGEVAQVVSIQPGIDLATEVKVADLIHAYRLRGQQIADINPLRPAPTSHEALELSSFGLTAADLEKTFQAGKLIGIGAAKLSQIIQHLKNTYCRTIGIELGHIQDKTAREWLQTRVESIQGKEALDTETRRMILRRLTESETFERFLHTRYVAQKRFSVEGGESVIPALDSVIEMGAELGAKEFVIGMAHRGRLNVLTNIFGKKPEMIFTEFEGQYKVDTTLGEGDVKYHKGYSTDFLTRKSKKVHLSLQSNPSHLEFINAVVEGVARAKQQKLNDSERSQVIPIQVHGDAAFAGQGVCYEVINLSQLKGYSTGGTVHIVINNQVGFTTSPHDSRSTTYCTDLGKMLDSPIFHVNADDPEAVWFVAKMAIEYRQKFKSDAFIDLICYRKHGHNEGDEPTFTQPLLYKAIKAHSSTRTLYAEYLGKEGVVTPEESQLFVDQVMEHLSEAQKKAKSDNPQPHTSVFEGAWNGLRRPAENEVFKSVVTAVTESKLKELSEKLNHLPASFHLHSKLGRFFEARHKAVSEGKGIDWGNAETLAFASLVEEGIAVRLSGQDAERGTFTHRHSVLTDTETGEQYTPLNHLKDGQAPYMVHNSSLSETGVLGYEYGYAIADPKTLVIWEAQFGDFANGAQVIIDQFIASSESKWQRMSGIVMLLPHGYEGQGPEHSSARLERFLNLCGRNNMAVCNLTTPAQIFHVLRRQMKRDFRKPLIIMSPKSLLRHPMAVSNIDEFTQSGFMEALDDPQTKSPADAQAVKRVLFCTGKVYYDLLAEKIAKNRKDVAIIRIEQLYPWPSVKLSSYANAYSQATDFVWVQEEPQNMGAWQYVFGTWMGALDHFNTQVGGRKIRYVGREIGAAPAVGSAKLHEKEQKAIVEKAFGEEK